MGGYVIRLGKFYKNLAKKNEFHENKLSGNQILHKDVSEFLHIPPAFPENFVISIQKNSTQFFYQQLLAT